MTCPSRWAHSAPSRWTYFVLLLLFAAGCEEPFVPIQTPDDLHFTMQGFLDASVSADTQWIRVGRIRTALHTEPGPLDATVTLEHLATGDITLLRDSLFIYQRELDSEVIAYNYWTTEPIEPGATYRLRATGPDGVSASATVEVPETFPPRIGVRVTRSRLTPDFVRVEGVEHLAMVHVLHHIPKACVLGFSIFHTYPPVPNPPLEEGLHSVPIRSYIYPDSVDAAPGTCEPYVRKREIRLVASGTEWPYNPQLTSGVVAHVDVASNVENGVGYVGGVITTTIPYELCFYPSVPFGIPVCDLDYGPESASIGGVVRDFYCGGLPLEEAAITLQEVESGRLRPAWADLEGFYEIGGLVPGVVHRLVVSHEGHPDRGSRSFVDHEEDLVFDVGQRLDLDVDMRWETNNCPPAEPGPA